MTHKALWGGLGLALLTTALVSTLGDDTAEATAAPHLVDRLWIDHMPDGDRDLVGKLAVVRSLEHGRFGVLEHGSVWRQRTEIFQWTLRDSRLDTRWPQDREHLSFTVHTRECEDEAPEPFELCLDLTEDGDTVTLYSRWDWVIRPRAEDDERVDDPLVHRWLERLEDTLPDQPVVVPETSGPRGPLGFR